MTVVCPETTHVRGALFWIGIIYYYMCNIQRALKSPGTNGADVHLIAYTGQAR